MQHQSWDEIAEILVISLVLSLLDILIHAPILICPSVFRDHAVCSTERLDQLQGTS